MSLIPNAVIVELINVNSL